jgi:2-haloacid dehalogenase
VSDDRVDTVFFDLFGTLLSLAPLDAACDRLAPGRGAEIAGRWRRRQLEASWLLTAMDRWVDFDVVTRDALAATLDELGVAAPADLDAIAAAFLDLPLADEATDALRGLREHGRGIGVLTNASSTMLARVTGRLGPTFDHLLSVDAARRYKPSPSVYQLAVDATGLEPARVGFVTANGWDAAGAGVFGLRVAWLRPDPSARLPPVGAPDPTIATWADIVPTFVGASVGGRQGTDGRSSV